MWLLFLAPVLGFCSALPDDEESEECWDAYRYYEDKRVSNAICIRPSRIQLSAKLLFVSCRSPDHVFML